MVWMNLSANSINMAALPYSCCTVGTHSVFYPSLRNNCVCSFGNLSVQRLKMIGHVIIWPSRLCPFLLLILYVLKKYRISDWRQ